MTGGTLTSLDKKGTLKDSIDEDFEENEDFLVDE